jgi:hypothetical protein
VAENYYFFRRCWDAWKERMAENEQKSKFEREKWID